MVPLTLTNTAAVAPPAASMAARTSEQMPASELGRHLRGCHPTQCRRRPRDSRIFAPFVTVERGKSSKQKDTIGSLIFDQIDFLNNRLLASTRARSSRRPNTDISADHGKGALRVVCRPRHAGTPFPRASSAPCRFASIACSAARFRALRSIRRRLHPCRHDPSHAPTLDEGIRLLMIPDFLDRLLGRTIRFYGNDLAVEL